MHLDKWEQIDVRSVVEKLCPRSARTLANPMPGFGCIRVVVFTLIGIAIITVVESLVGPLITGGLILAIIIAWVLYRWFYCSNERRIAPPNMSPTETWIAEIQEANVDPEARYVFMEIIGVLNSRDSLYSNKAEELQYLLDDAKAYPSLCRLKLIQELYKVPCP